jgi:hypothetical protein
LSFSEILPKLFNILLAILLAILVQQWLVHVHWESAVGLDVTNSLLKPPEKKSWSDT